MLNKIYKNYDVNKKYAIRKFAVGTFSVAIGLLATNMNELPVIGYTGPNIVHASEVTNWQPEGNIIAQGEDGVPWELYENGYLLFKPTEGKDTLINDQNNSIWKNTYGRQIKAIGFTGKVYLPEYSSRLFSNESYSSLDNGKLSELEYVDTTKINTSRAKNISYLFSGNRKIKSLDLSNWDTSNITDMSGVFSIMRDIESLDLNNWNTSNVTNMSVMFADSEKIKTLNIDKWDTSNVTNMSGMFTRNNFTHLDLNKWNTSNVTDMSQMFSLNQSLEILNINKWNTSNVTNMSEMFIYDKNLESLDINQWDTSNVKNMSGMFAEIDKLTRLNLSGWNTSNVENMSRMFISSNLKSQLEELDLSNWDISNTKNINLMFYNLPKLKKIKISDKFKNNQLQDNPFSYLDYHTYGEKYTEKWVKEDKSSGPYTIEEWNKSYKENPQSMAGVWVREELLTTYTINFISETNEQFEPLSVERDQPITFPVPKIDKPGYKFRGWAKQGETLPGYGRDENGNLTIVQLPVVYANGVSNLAPLGGSVNMIDIWDKVDPETVETETVPYKTMYEADETLDKGESYQGTWGMDGRKEIRKVSKVKPITGELYDPVVTSEKIVTPPQNAIVYVGTKPKEETVEIPSPKKYVKDSTREKGADNIVENGKPGSKTITTTYIVNPENGDVTENVGEPVIVNPTETIIKVAAKNKVEIIKSNDKTIQRTTTYDVNPETGEITISNVTDKLISTNTPLIPNPEGADLPKVPEKNTNEKPEYTKPISTNSPTDDNGNLILPPVVEKPEFNGAVNSTEPPVSDKLEYNKPIENNEKPSETLINEKPEYTGPLSTNTPVDENGNLILPPVLEKPEYKGGVNSAEPQVENKPEYKEPVSTNTPVDNNGDLILPPAVEKPEYKDDSVETSTKEEKPVENKEQVKDKELPNTNSTSVLSSLVSSVIGTLGLGYKSKRRK